ncbi:MBL fold metallo-hydrolase [Caproiciproducens galactitolivorans]|uniref:MBL fold metallo-hydrolase n=1 Tax=Caproiciproducens galactitolivorans TaxID=642589 RepID=A0ABT4BP69_9FIRM|nr:MBL fold metallo-hydrolase [Caproiciproducens galactitolivorans]MCY1712682.1 MBL fold metallo-hydrolase [Caproiciproducens galactitolivorans]
MLEKLTDRIYFLPGEKKTDRPYLYYINGDTMSLAIDAGNSKRHVEKFYHELEERGFRKPDYTVITHWHWDHTFGMHAVAGKTIASVLTNQKLREVQNWEWTKQKMREREESGEDIAFCNQCILCEYENLKDIVVVPAEIEVKEKTAIDLGGIHCVLEPHDSTHSRDSLFLYIPEEKVLVVGDSDCEDYYGDGKYDQERLKNLTAYIEKFDFSTYVIGHDVPRSRKEATDFLKSQMELLE